MVAEREGLPRALSLRLPTCAASQRGLPVATTLNPVMPAKAGIQCGLWSCRRRAGTSMAVVRAASGCGGAGRGFWIPACAGMTSGGGLRRRSAGCCAVRVRAAAEIQPSPATPAAFAHRPTSPTLNPVIPAKAGIQCGLWRCQRRAGTSMAVVRAAGGLLAPRWCRGVLDAPPAGVNGWRRAGIRG